MAIRTRGIKLIDFDTDYNEQENTFSMLIALAVGGQEFFKKMESTKENQEFWELPEVKDSVGRAAKKLADDIEDEIVERLTKGSNK